jgi:hypothetical protein
VERDVRSLDDVAIPIDNRVENQIRPIAGGRPNWLFSARCAPDSVLPPS